MDSEHNCDEHCGRDYNVYILVQAVLATEGLAWLALAVLVAGVVRGFTGFGSALVYLPIAGIFLPPTWVIATTATFSIIGPLPLLPRAWRHAPKREVARLVVAGAAGVPLGVILLTGLAPESFRWIVSAVAVGTLGILASGWRYRREISPLMGAGTGFFAGLMGGFIGLPGPPVILLYLSGQKAVSEIRATILLFLFSTDVAVLVTLWLRGLVTGEAFAIGLLLVPSYMLGGLLGQRLFNPAQKQMFRGVAYGIILLAAVTGLPLFD